MARRCLSDTYIRSPQRVPKSGRTETMDTEARRLGIRVTDKEHRSFFYCGRFPGSPNPTRRHIGDYPTTTLSEAREKARLWDKLLADGIDPAIEQKRLLEERKRAAREEVEASENVFAARAREYLRTHCAHHRQARGTGRLIEKELMPSWHDRRIDQITAREIKALIVKLAERSPSTARNTLIVCKSFFQWALNRDYVEASPAAAIKPKLLLGEKKQRTRVLNDDEVVKFWNATGKLAYPLRQLYRLLLLTGVRLREAANAPWAEFDLERRVWVVEPERFKSDIRHVVPLSDQAMQLLDELPRCGPYLFSLDGKRPINSFSKSKKRLDALMGVEDWCVHDLRRVVRSHLSALHVSSDVAELALGHGKKGLARVYDQHAYEDELRDALQQWANKLRDMVTPPPPNVVTLPKPKKRKSA
jgi:integrase